MEQEYNITDAEWKVMEFIWAHPYSTMGEIRESLEKTTGWNSSTIKTLVLRLVKKDVLQAEGSARNNKYSARVKEDECRRKETLNFLDRIYNGSVKMMVSNLVRDSKLSGEEIDELMSIIDKMED